MTGPFDDDETNHDPDSWVGEEDERGFEEMNGWGEMLFAEDDGYDDGEPDEDEEDDDDEDDEGDE